MVFALNFISSLGMCISSLKLVAKRSEHLKYYFLSVLLFIYLFIYKTQIVFKGMKQKVQLTNNCT